ncbi:hypothetical protein FISHEDRAFT_77692 [Fistulina hepatica ATCC 64428]|nr:hypothetical protein FISHEDRAFT_77692 [Fistulina hepatica ATCC 64428]
MASANSASAHRSLPSPTHHPPQHPVAASNAVRDPTTKRTIRRAIRPSTAPEKVAEASLPSLPAIHRIAEEDRDTTAVLGSTTVLGAFGFAVLFNVPGGGKTYARCQCGVISYWLAQLEVTMHRFWSAYPHVSFLRPCGDHYVVVHAFGRAAVSLPSKLSPSDSFHDNQMPSTRARTVWVTDYDWATFMERYAAGDWQPQRSPHPPTSYPTAIASEPPASAPAHTPSYSTNSSHSQDGTVASTQARSQSNFFPVPHTTSTRSMRFSAHRLFRPTAPSGLPLPPIHRFRNSFSSTSSPGFPDTSPCSTPSAEVNAEYQTIAATARLAGFNGLDTEFVPSPERELLDPMHGAVATIPGSYDHGSSYRSYASYEIGAGSSRRRGKGHGLQNAHVNDLWSGIQDIDPSSQAIDSFTFPDDDASNDEPDMSDVSLPSSTPVSVSPSRSPRARYTSDLVSKRGNLPPVSEDPCTPPQILDSSGDPKDADTLIHSPIPEGLQHADHSTSTVNGVSTHAASGLAFESLPPPEPSSSRSSAVDVLSLSKFAGLATVGPSVPHTCVISTLDDEDYFGSVTPFTASPPQPFDVVSPPTTLTSDAVTPPISVLSEDAEEGLLRANYRTLSSPGPFAARDTAGLRALPEATMSAPVQPHRISLTRQSSAPLPERTRDEALTAPIPHEYTRFIDGRDQGVHRSRRDRATFLQQRYDALGYLEPPKPPDEEQRLQKLHQFNIWHTDHDANFDRIAHTVQLVFHVKSALISLINGEHEWFKTESANVNGARPLNEVPRGTSFGGHAILRPDDEPMVILDATRDWRFAKNPLVTGSPGVRFYAGAPLRVSMKRKKEGGKEEELLAIIDYAPRSEFSPRDRHVLKEFAKIVMREMELWKDTIQIRIRSRIQSSMEQFSRECLMINSGTVSLDGQEGHAHLTETSAMDEIYDRAATLVRDTLDKDHVLVLDVSHSEVRESTSAEGAVSVIVHNSDQSIPRTTQNLSPEEYHRIDSFFTEYPEGTMFWEIVPRAFRRLLPSHLQCALVVPIYNVDKRPFAILCAYNDAEHPHPYVRVIILSAVLKRRINLADKAKGLFISNISHELRTPLYGILAAAELLIDTPLSPLQQSFLKTVQACGNSLVETVNHVLDFTKLSGNAKAGGVENVIVPCEVNMTQLVEEAIDGCWVGHRARTRIMAGSSAIGNIYEPPKQDLTAPTFPAGKHVETVVDIGLREQGWNVVCERSGLRRVLMNIFGNSLKFTSDGFIHVLLRELPSKPGDPPNRVQVELAVIDTGKVVLTPHPTWRYETDGLHIGNWAEFSEGLSLLFHPFTQENPLQAGTGLGLAIVKSIVTSDSIKGEIDLRSDEGVGTEVRVTFSAEVKDNVESECPAQSNVFKFVDPDAPPTVSLINFDGDHKGTQLLRDVVKYYLQSWWHFKVSDDSFGDIVLLNETIAPVAKATEERDTSRPFIILSEARGSLEMAEACSEHEAIGGFCRVIFKPMGPSSLRSALVLAVHALHIHGSTQENSVQAERLRRAPYIPPPVTRRSSEEGTFQCGSMQRPTMTPRSITVHSEIGLWQSQSGPVDEHDGEDPKLDPDTSTPTITVGFGGTLLKSSADDPRTDKPSSGHFRMLVVEDNVILRDLLTKWLSSKGYDFSTAVDGQDGVNVFGDEGPFEYDQIIIV